MSDTPNLFSWKPAPVYPHAPAEGRTDTSRAAAKIVRQNHKAIQDAVYASLEREPGNWKEVSARLDMDTRSVQPRFSELKKLGRIRDSGIRRGGCAVMEVVK